LLVCQYIYHRVWRAHLRRWRTALPAVQ
jgi:hypothetical protein